MNLTILKIRLNVYYKSKNFSIIYIYYFFLFEINSSGHKITYNIIYVVSLRSKTWRRFSLKQKVDSSVMPEPVQQSVRVGDTGMTVSRLAPMGKVEIGGKIYEAKSMDSYIDPRREVEVVGFENFNIIVRKHIK